MKIHHCLLIQFAITVPNATGMMAAISEDEYRELAQQAAQGIHAPVKPFMPDVISVNHEYFADKPAGALHDEGDNSDLDTVSISSSSSSSVSSSSNSVSDVRIPPRWSDMSRKGSDLEDIPIDWDGLLLRKDFSDNSNDFGTFDTTVIEYFKENFGDSGTKYLSEIFDQEWRKRWLNLDDTLRGKIKSAALKINEKYRNGKSFWRIGSRKKNEISFRLHRIIGAFEFIKLRVDSSAMGPVTDVLSGANAFIYFSTDSMRKTIARIRDKAKSNFDHTLLLHQLVGKIGYSRNNRPQFMEQLFKFIDKVMVKPELHTAAESLIGKINKTFINKQTIDETENEITKELAAALLIEPVAPKTQHTSET